MSSTPLVRAINMPPVLCSQGLHLETCGRLGAAAAAEVITHMGPRPLMSYKDLAQGYGLI
jgi:sugar/nucleoside kinase (ribokinase family)